MQDRKFIVIYDTYCGWCYGAAPIFDALVASGAEVEPLHRHLFQGARAYRMNAGKGDAVMVADARIAALTGQTFSQAYIDNIVKSETEVLASNLTAQAAALVHDQGAAKEFAVRHRLETARYVDGTSAADRDAVIDALIAEGVAPELAQTIGTPELAERAKATAQRAAILMDVVGSQGVPTILEVQGDSLSVVNHSAYYSKPAAIAA
ncbi:hypothetical protein [Tritonibacter scottomollicae]|uniref:hypothetical protein n=1 Tax=Tritonibacter scottomollicae TaxID=483013 RepID=UPI003AA7F5D0